MCAAAVRRHASGPKIGEFLASSECRHGLRGIAGDLGLWDASIRGSVRLRACDGSSTRRSVTWELGAVAAEALDEYGTLNP